MPEPGQAQTVVNPAFCLKASLGAGERVVGLFPELHGTWGGVCTRSPPAPAGGFYGIRCIREGLPMRCDHEKHSIVLFFLGKRSLLVLRMASCHAARR